MQRNLGLDIARSIAILLVLIAHLAPFFTRNPFIYNVLFHSGLYGVELFFVLSGYLIGQIVLKKFTTSISLKKIQSFYSRRLLRILPLYYFLLACFTIITNTVSKTKLLHLLHFIFLQNFIETEVSFFAVSWTLSIQFWFYIFIPLLIFIFSYKRFSVRKMFKRLIFFTLIIIFLRLLYVYFNNPLFDFGVRKNIFFRFYSLLIGVIFALIKQSFKPYIYSFLTNIYSFLVSIFGLSIFYVIYVYLMINHGINYFNHSVFYRSFSWPIISLMLMIFIVYLENNHWIKTILSRKKIYSYIFTQLSRYSFAVFLIHYEIYTYFETNLKTLNIGLSIMISTTIIFLLAFLLYNLIEKPILLKRKGY